MPNAHSIGYGLPVSPQARKVLPLIPQILAEGWSAAKVAEKTGIGLRACKGYLSTIQNHIAAEAHRDGEIIRLDALAVARRVQANKVARLERVEAMLERLTDAMEAGELDGEAIERLVRTDQRHNDLARSLSGIDLAEKAALARLKGESIGQGFGKAMIDATAMDLSGQVWDALPAAGDDASEGESSPE